MDKALRIVKTAIDWLFGVLIVIVLGLVVTIVVVPRCMGGTSLTVLTGSMEPDIKPGDMVVTRGVDAANQDSFVAGQVIAFLPYPNNPTVVTHRIVEVDNGADGISYVTKGDANNANDPWGPVAASHVRGEVVYVVPKVGYVRQWVMLHVPVSATVMGVVLIAYGVFAFFSTMRRKPKGEGASRALAQPSRALAQPDVQAPPTDVQAPPTDVLAQPSAPVRARRAAPVGALEDGDGALV